MNLYDIVAKNVSLYPGKTAIKYLGQTLCYASFGEMVEQTASACCHLGVRSGDIVTVALPSTPESMAVVYALNKIGAVVNTMDVRFTAAQVTSIVNGLKAKMLFVMDFNSKEVAAVADQMCVEHIVVIRGGDVFLPRDSAKYLLYRLFGGCYHKVFQEKKFMQWDDLLALSNGVASSHRWSDDSAQMIFQTSGTTGRTKSVMLTAENIASAVESTREVMNAVASSDTVLGLIPLFAFYGFATTIHLPLALGLTVDIVPIWKPKNFVKTIARHKAQHVFTVPSSWDYILRSSSRRTDLSSLKTVEIAGDVVRPEYERAINDYLARCGCKYVITKVYGMTETAGIVACTPQSSPHKYDMGFSGQATAGHRVRIDDGEVLVSHATKLLGYYGDEEATASLLTNDENGVVWLHTGDYGNLDGEGNLYVSGRMKRMLVRFDGTKVFPVEIEDALLRHPEVRNCAVVGVRDDKHPQSSLPVAFCVVKNKDCKTKNSLIRFAKESLQEYLRPSQILFLDEIPVTERGKVDYSRLCELV